MEKEKSMEVSVEELKDLISEMPEGAQVCLLFDEEAKENGKEKCRFSYIFFVSRIHDII